MCWSFATNYYSIYKEWSFMIIFLEIYSDFEIEDSFEQLLKYCDEEKIKQKEITISLNIKEKYEEEFSV
jgi:hypothetical protein